MFGYRIVFGAINVLFGLNLDYNACANEPKIIQYDREGTVEEQLAALAAQVEELKAAASVTNIILPSFNWFALHCTLRELAEPKLVRNEQKSTCF